MLDSPVDRLSEPRSFIGRLSLSRRDFRSKREKRIPGGSHCSSAFAQMWMRQDLASLRQDMITMKPSNFEKRCVGFGDQNWNAFFLTKVFLVAGWDFHLIVVFYLPRSSICETKKSCSLTNWLFDVYLYIRVYVQFIFSSHFRSYSIFFKFVLASSLPSSSSHASTFSKHTYSLLLGTESPTSFPWKRKEGPPSSSLKEEAGSR